MLTERVPLVETGIPLKFAMRHLAGAVSVVTAGVGDERTGAAVTTAHSLSVEPEVVVVSINLGSSTWAAIDRHRHFCVNVLRADHSAIADRFTGRGGLKGPARYAGARWSGLATSALALDGALAAVDGTVEDCSPQPRADPRQSPTRGERRSRSGIDLSSRRIWI